ncbi:hypothetical protein EUGRSUZ_H00552 [Eucalyptus grandis]|uniref:Uncharacterized protein n=2 Tax=Eucalyptus grandis TaxID=71139 RepID=A0ACC3JMR4_EUCGR|nr:hypothetical protein EUGRSUZ_H00552 [Eucalyptus grandis]
MNHHARNNRRPRMPAQSARQEWVPRGSVPNGPPANPPAPANLNPSSDDGNFPSDSGHASSFRAFPPDSGHRGNLRGNNGFANHSSGPRGNHGPRGHPARPLNQRREKEKAEFSGDRVSNDPNLPQLVQEIQEKLMKGTVECMICYDMVRRSAPIWSCSSCYSIFHLNCIKKWARAPTSVDLSAEKNQGGNWRCPGCQHVQLTSSKEIRYMCFCGKRTDPPSDLYLTPHSCGEPCGKPLEKDILQPGEKEEDFCPHLCVLQCHPGPCPPCKAFAPPRLCPCGKETITTRCSDRRSVLTCGKCCDKLLECGRHRCKQICHVGPCDPCQVLLNASCFCRKNIEVVLCGDMAMKGEVDAESGVFSCNSTCEKLLSCGNHMCDKFCHPGPCGECDLLPGRIKTCYCGKMNLMDERQNCLDPIPTCSQGCDKLLPCGTHFCAEMCHAGICPPCPENVAQKCRCGLTSRTVECHRTREEIFTCDKPCGRKKNCGRHRCSERCCPLSNSSNLPLGDWDPHLCSMVCGKKLRCGQHSCESLCHSGHCPPCLETIFTDLTCACGRTSIPPPLPCGTPPPSCQLPCLIPQPCGHSSTHSCHFGDCPPCSVPVAKECIGGHVVLRNIPCGSKDIRCNKTCGKTRQCGLHACGRTCHPLPCDSDNSASETSLKVSCGQVCGAPRRDCRHTCKAPCHPSASCPDARCDSPVTITCSCGRITASVPCDAGGANGNFSTDTVFEASIMQKLPVPLQPVEATGKRIPLGQRKLVCDDDCAKVERKRVLADAFDINPPNLETLHFGEHSYLSESVVDLFRRDSKWVLAVEERCKFLVLGKGRGSATSLKVHVFCPMLKEKRDAVRLIAERWKLVVSAAGWEPKRFVVLHATSKSKVPARVLGGRGSITSNVPHPPTFDPLVDMDPRLVVSFLDLPREADISALVLRFGGECELVWLNDKNALAVFSDPARAATALRRLDHGTAYYGAVVLQNGSAASSLTMPNAWGGAGPAKEGASIGAIKGNPWKRAVVQEVSDWKEDSWGGEGWSIDSQSSILKEKEAPISASVNRWSVLDSENATSSSAPLVGKEINSIKFEDQVVVGPESKAGGSSSEGTQGLVSSGVEATEVVDDWEEACE